MMLVGALAGVAGAFFGRSTWLGILAGIAGGLAMAALFAFVSVSRGADQVVAGLSAGYATALGKAYDEQGQDLST